MEGGITVMKKKLLVLGESYMNLQMKTDPPQKEGALTFGSSYSFHPYGEGAMTAISAAKLGGSCVFCTKLGNDMNGERLKKYYKACGLDISLVETKNNAQTGMSVTLFNDITDGHTFVSKGANLTFTKRDIDDAFSSYPDMFIVPQDDLLSEKVYIPKNALTEDIEPEDGPTEMIDISSLNLSLNTKKQNDVEDENDEFTQTMVFSSEKIAVESEENAINTDDKTEDDMSLALYATKLASERNIDLVVHYNRYTSKLPLNTIDGIKILVISDEMLSELSGICPNSIDKTLRAIMPFANNIRSQYYVVQQGNDSVFIYDGKYYEIITLPETLKAKARQESPHMHGTFIGAVATRFLETRDIVDACKYACVVSILTHSKFGCLDHAPTRQEIAEFTAEK